MHKLCWKCRNEANREKIIMKLLLGGRQAFLFSPFTVRIFKKAISIWMFPNQLCIWASSRLLFHTLCLRSRCRFIKLDRKRFPCIFHYGSRFFFSISKIILWVCVCVENSMNEGKIWSRTIPLVRFKAPRWWFNIRNQRRKIKYNKRCCWAHFLRSISVRCFLFLLLYNQIFQLFGANHKIDTYGTGLDFTRRTWSHTILPTGSILCCISPMLSWRVCSTVITSI